MTTATLPSGTGIVSMFSVAAIVTELFLEIWWVKQTIAQFREHRFLLSRYAVVSLTARVGSLAFFLGHPVRDQWIVLVVAWVAVSPALYFLALKALPAPERLSRVASRALVPTDDVLWRAFPQTAALLVAMFSLAVVLHVMTSWPDFLVGVVASLPGVLGFIAVMCLHPRPGRQPDAAGEPAGHAYLRLRRPLLRRFLTRILQPDSRWWAIPTIVLGLGIVGLLLGREIGGSAPVVASGVFRAGVIAAFFVVLHSLPTQYRAAREHPRLNPGELPSTTKTLATLAIWLVSWVAASMAVVALIVVVMLGAAWWTCLAVLLGNLVLGGTAAVWTLRFRRLFPSVPAARRIP